MKTLWPDVTEQNQGLSLMHDPTISVEGNRFLFTGFQPQGRWEPSCMRGGHPPPLAMSWVLNAPKVHLRWGQQHSYQLAVVMQSILNAVSFILPSPIKVWGEYALLFGGPHSAPHYTEARRNLTLLLFLGSVVQYLLIHDFIEYNDCK